MLYAAHKGQIGVLMPVLAPRQTGAMTPHPEIDDSDIALLATVIGMGSNPAASRQYARQLLQRFGNLRMLLHADDTELLSCQGIGHKRLAMLQALPALAQRYYENSLPPGTSIRNPSDTEFFLKARLQHLKHELFCCLYLDNRHQVLRFDELFRGTIDGTSVYPREVIRAALDANAAAVILVHNHPSGVAEPSQADERISKRLKSALDLVDIRLLDHLIIGAGPATSLARRGLL